MLRIELDPQGAPHGLHRVEEEAEALAPVVAPPGPRVTGLPQGSRADREGRGHATTAAPEVGLPR